MLASELSSIGIDIDNYVVRIVDEEPNAIELAEKMADPESQTPVIAVTVDLLTTGVDIPPVKNIVIMRPISSKVLFKQIIGRGSRICESANKYKFRIIDFVDATRLLDPWDIPTEQYIAKVPKGPFDYYVKGKVVDAEDLTPIENARITAKLGVNLVKSARTDEKGEFLIEGCPRSSIKIKIEAKGYKTKEITIDPLPYKDKIAIVVELKRKNQNKGKIIVRGINVYVEEEYFVEVEGKKLKKAEYIKYAKNTIREKVITLDDLRKIWINPELRKKFLEELERKSINPEILAKLLKREDSDAFDIIAHVAFDAPLISRDERVQAFLNKKQRFINSFGGVAKKVLLNLIEKYKIGGIDEISIDALKSPDIQKMVKLKTIINEFGGVDKVRKFFNELIKNLYEV